MYTKILVLLFVLAATRAAPITLPAQADCHMAQGEFVVDTSGGTTLLMIPCGITSINYRPVPTQTKGPGYAMALIAALSKGTVHTAASGQQPTGVTDTTVSATTTMLPEPQEDINLNFINIGHTNSGSNTQQ